MRRILFSLFALFILALPAAARAANAYDILFNPKNLWLNTARPVTAADAKGRLVLLDFWTYGCINCMQVVPDLKALEAHYGDKLLIIGVHSAKFVGERDSDRILAAAKRFGITHPVINDSSFDVWEGFKVDAWPTLVLIGGDGVEINRYAGEGHRADIEADINKSLDSLTGSATKVADLQMKVEDKSILSFPSRLGFASDTPWGELLFVADSGHNRILGVALDGTIKVTIGQGAEGMKNGSFELATFNHPRGFGVAKNGIYVADTSNHLIRFIDFQQKLVSTVAGTGKQGNDRGVSDAAPLETSLASPWDVKMLADGKSLVIAMAGLHQLWLLDTAKNTISTLAGSGREDIADGNANDAALAQPSGLSPLGNTIYFVDAESSALRSLKFGTVSTQIGTGLFDFGKIDGSYPKALLQHAQGLDANAGRIVIADTYNNALRLYDITDGRLSTIALKDGELQEPGDVLQLNGKIYVADTNHNRIAVVDDKAGEDAAKAMAEKVMTTHKDLVGMGVWAPAVVTTLALKQPGAEPMKKAKKKGK